MNVLLRQIQRDPSYARMERVLRARARTVLARGIPRTARGAIAAALACSLDRTCLVIVPDSDTADQITMDAEALLLPSRSPVPRVKSDTRTPGISCDSKGEEGGGVSVHPFPAKDILTSEDQQAERERLGVLDALARGQRQFIVTTGLAVAEMTVPPDLFLNSRFAVEEGEEIDRDVLSGQLIDTGYERTDTVEAVGQFSVRGGIVDVYPPSISQPARLEFLGNRIDSIRLFDIRSQRSRDRVRSCLISTPHEVVLTRARAQAAVQRVLNVLTQRCEELRSEGKTTVADDLESRVTEHMSHMEALRYFSDVLEYLPLLYPEHPTLLDHLPHDVLVIVIESHAIELHLERIREEHVRGLASRIGAGESLPLGPGILPYDALAERVRARQTLFVTLADETVDEDSDEELESEDHEDEETPASLILNDDRER